MSTGPQDPRVLFVKRTCKRAGRVGGGGSGGGAVIEEKEREEVGGGGSGGGGAVIGEKERAEATLTVFSYLPGQFTCFTGSFTGATLKRRLFVPLSGEAERIPRQRTSGKSRSLLALLVQNYKNGR